MLDSLEWIDRWMVAADPDGVLRSEQRRFGASGTHVAGFVYADHTAGITMDVETFCTVGPEGEIHPTGGPRRHNSVLKVRYDILEQLSPTPIADHERERLGWPARPGWLSTYRHPELEPLRRLPLLHPLRAPGYPDDIRFLLLPVDEEGRPEVVWGRLERALGGCDFECVLLNQPQQECGLSLHDRVVVNVREVEDGVVPICLGPLSAYGGDDPEEL